LGPPRFSDLRNGILVDANGADGAVVCKPTTVRRFSEVVRLCFGAEKEGKGEVL
jgi:hypothetical protein